MSKTEAKVLKKPIQQPPSRLRQLLSPGYLMIGGGIIILAVILVIIVQNTVAEQHPLGDLGIPDTSISYPNLGQTHIEVGASHPPYNSNPPTSGWHYPQPAEWGIYNTQLPDELLVHNLEHGGIWLSYKDPTNQDIINQLTDIANKYPYPSHIILEPRPEDDAPIAVAAWGHLLNMDTVNTDIIYAFIRRYRLNGPEKV